MIVLAWIKKSIKLFTHSGNKLKSDCYQWNWIRDMPLKWVVIITFISDLLPFRKVIMHALQSITLACLVDDPVQTSTLSEFLLQVQSGLPQGSLRSGLNTRKGSVLISTNSAECERWLLYLNNYSRAIKASKQTLTCMFINSCKLLNTSQVCIHCNNVLNSLTLLVFTWGYVNTGKVHYCLNTFS